VNRFTFVAFVAAALFFRTPLVAQDLPPAYIHPYQRIAVPNLAQFRAADDSRPAVLKAVVATVLSGLNVKCGSGSQLYSVLEANAELPLRAVAAKISGASCSMEGRTLHVNATFAPNGAIKANGIVASVMQHQPLLLEWKNRIYVLYGVVYDQHLYNTGAQDNVIREFLLIDPRYSDTRRFLAFNRAKDNFADVAGIATISVVGR
jgi:hypothetical protein